MSTKYVSDTKAGKAISAYVILDKKGKLVGKIHAHWSDSGVCTVNLSDWTKEDPDKYFQRATAGGYGYDKLASCLGRMTFAGYQLTDHCGTDERIKRLFARYLKEHAKGGFTDAKDAAFRRAAKSIGANFANWSTTTNRYGSLYRMEWKQFMEAMGYRVIQAI